MPTLLNPQSQVPTLDLPLTGGGKFKLSEASPKHFQILVFYRGYHCPKCKDQLQDIDSQFSDLKQQGLDALAISMDSAERAKMTQDEWDIKNLPIAYGLPLLTAKDFGLFISNKHGDKEPEIFAEPGLFVVKPDGTLYAEYVQNTPFGRPAITDIAAGLEFVVKNDYPTRGTSTR